MISVLICWIVLVDSIDKSQRENQFVLVHAMTFYQIPSGYGSCHLTTAPTNHFAISIFSRSHSSPHRGEAKSITVIEKSPVVSPNSDEETPNLANNPSCYLEQMKDRATPTESSFPERSEGSLP
jgi:hypothetical protein